MMTSTNTGRQTSNGQHNNVINVSESLRDAQHIDYFSEDETYELLPSGD